MANKRKETNFIVIHCSATRPDWDGGVAEIDVWHRKRGWNKIGYHEVIRRDGTWEPGRLPDEIGAGVKGHNRDSYHICVVGGLDENGQADWLHPNFTPKQWVTLEERVGLLMRVYPEAAVVGHRDFPNTNKACPCFDVTRWVERTFG